MESPTVHLFEINEDELELSRFNIDGEINRQYRRINAEGTQLTVGLYVPLKGEDAKPYVPFPSQCDRSVRVHSTELSNSDMVGITVSPEVNVQDKAIGISFRRKDQLT